MAVVASGDCNRPVGAFNPAWCLRPQTPTGKGATSRSRWWEHDRSAGTPSVSGSMHTSRGRRARHRRVSSSDVASADPPSPRVGCMGQVRGCRAAGSGGSPPVRTKFQLLRRMFSGRSALGSTAAAESPQAKTSEGTSGRGVAPVVISMAELDPPLPVVIRRAAAGGGDEMRSLWKRRCAGGAPGPGPEPEGLQLRPQRQTRTRWLHQETPNPAGKVLS